MVSSLTSSTTAWCKVGVTAPDPKSARSGLDATLPAYTGPSTRPACSTNAEGGTAELPATPHLPLVRSTGTGTENASHLPASGPAMSSSSSSGAEEVRTCSLEPLRPLFASPNSNRDIPRQRFAVGLLHNCKSDPATPASSEQLVGCTLSHSPKPNRDSGTMASSEHLAAGALLVRPAAQPPSQSESTRLPKLASVAAGAAATDFLQGFVVVLRAGDPGAEESKLVSATACEPNWEPPRGAPAAGKALGLPPGLRPGLGHERNPGIAAAMSSSSRLPAGERALFVADTGSGRGYATGSGRGYEESSCVLGMRDAATAATL